MGPSRTEKRILWTREAPVSEHFGLEVADWIVLERSRPNALIIGPNESIEAFCTVLRSVLPGSVFTDGRRLHLPQTICQALFVMNAEHLNPDDQLRLLGWLTRDGGHTQTITTATFPIFPLIAEGMLLDALYYRLNVMTVMLHAHG